MLRIFKSHLGNFVGRYKKRQAYKLLFKHRDNPESLQRNILMQLVRANQDSEFGRAHDFDKIRNYADFKKNVPVRTSEQYLPLLNGLYASGQAALTKSPPYFYAMTSGTTGSFKHVPITRKSRQETDNCTLAFLYFLENAFPKLKSASFQLLVGSAEGGVSPTGVPQGFISGFNYKSLPKFITERFAIPYWVFTQEDTHDLYYAMARFMINCEDLYAVGAISPLYIINVAKSIYTNIDQLKDDLIGQKLTLGEAAFQQRADQHTFRLYPEKVEAIEHYKRLEHPTQVDKQKLLKILLPELETVVTWTGGNMGYTLGQLEDYFGKVSLFEMPFSASEGIFSIPYASGEKSGIAAVNGHFLEYIPEEEIDKEAPTVLPAWELTQGQRYYQLVTSGAGLYRYNMEDLVEVTGFWGKVPTVEFITKRTKQVSIVNERISENDVTEVVRATATNFSLQFDHFIFFPSAKGHYQMVVNADSNNLREFLQEMEATMRRLIPIYDLHRQADLLKAVKISVVDRAELGNYIRSRQFKTKLANGQFKPIHLSSTVDGHLEFTILKEYSVASVPEAISREAQYAV